MTRTVSNAHSPEAARAKAALAWAHSARFLTTAARLDQLPPTELAEIAFVGRSNAGKSTAINRLAQQKRLAFASRTPGRTQHINLFAVGPKDAPDALFVDLPGYGYAAVERAAKLRWQEVMAHYLAQRRSLSGVVLMIDSRLGFTDLDQQLLQLIAPRLNGGAVRLLVLLTKSDKLDAQRRGPGLERRAGAAGRDLPRACRRQREPVLCAEGPGHRRRGDGAARLGAAGRSRRSAAASDDDVAALEEGQGHAQVFAQVRERARSSIRWRRSAARLVAWGCRH